MVKSQLKIFALVSCRTIVFFLAFLAAIAGVMGQKSDAPCAGTDNSKAVKYLDQARNLYKQKRDYEAAQSLAHKAIEQDAGYGDALFFLADIARRHNDFTLARETYLKLIATCPDYDADPYFQLGTYYYSLKKYSEAAAQLAQYVEFSNVPAKKYEEASVKLEDAKFYDRMFSHPVPFDPQSISNVCTYQDEYLPAISPDNEFLFYTNRFQKTDKNSLTPKLIEEFNFARKVNGSFGVGEKMPPPFNQQFNEGGATMTVDNKELFFTICQPDKGYINCDIYTSVLIDGKWSPITNLGPAVNSPGAWDSQPSISPDGRTLYFASMRDGGQGGVDIYKSERKKDGTWSTAANLGAPVNSPLNEKSPFIHQDNRTLYFTSDGHKGLGGFDIFISKKLENGNFSKPVNIGYPINSDADDLGFMVSTDGKTGYFASNKLNGKGGWDIYSLNLYEEARPDKVLFIKGEISGDNKNIPLAAKIELKNVKTNKVHELDVDTVTGQYVSVVNFNSDYIMTIKKDGYAYNSQYFASGDPALAKPVKVDVSLKKIEIGGIYKLNDILFETNSFELNDTSRAVIDGFVLFLKENPKVKVAIHGHTDNVGDAHSNQMLSDNRSKSVEAYINKRGIDTQRLAARGYGMSKPVGSNDNEEGRALNRRTEFVITSK